VGRYDSPVPSRCLAPLNYFKISALYSIKALVYSEYPYCSCHCSICTVQIKRDKKLVDKNFYKYVSVHRCNSVFHTAAYIHVHFRVTLHSTVKKEFRFLSLSLLAPSFCSIFSTEVTKSWTLEQAQIKHHIPKPQALRHFNTSLLNRPVSTHLHDESTRQFSRGGRANFSFSVHKSQILEFLGSFRYRKSVNFLDVPVCKSQFRNFYLQITNPQF
jgi:hypothetical protein